MRVESGTHWAVIPEAPWTWSQRNKVRDAAARDTFYQSFAVALVTCRVTEWSEPGEPSDPAAWETVPDTFGDAVFAAALKQWSAAPDPNAQSGDDKSSPSPQDSPSETPTTSS